jgi:hypothetical protein
MKVEHLKGLSVLLISALLVLSSGGIVHADTTTKPYLKTFGSDVMSGGWFNDGTNCATGSSSNYQDPNFAAPGFPANPLDGGILTYAKQASGNSAGGASSQYGAFSLGAIDDNSGAAGYGFYSAGARAAAGTSAKALSFANSGAIYPFGGPFSLGGVFEGTVRQSSCVPDYYSKMPANTTNTGNLSAAVARGSDNYSASPPAGKNFNLTAGVTTTISAGPPAQRITIYVNGNVYIDSNITYDSKSTVSSVPKFALIVKGSIYIDKSVTQLDGMYVAQPVPKCDASGLPAGCNSDPLYNPVSADSGIIWTCHPNNSAKLDYTYPPNCSSPLVVNGALIAKQVNFLRVGGTTVSTNSDVTTTASTSEDRFDTVNTCSTFPYTNCHVSEVVNYTPAMIMGGNFFSAASSGTGTGLPVDSIVSLPPVF